MMKLAPNFWILSLLLACSGAQAVDERVLVFSKTVGFRHPSITNGIAMLQDLATQNQFIVETTETADDFNATNLARFKAVVWLSTTGDVLNDAQQSAFQNWLEAGGGYVGIHAAADCEYSWPWYGASALGNGAWFQSHPAIQTAQLVRERAFDASTAHFPATFNFTDEWYNFRANPRAGSAVLLRLDETSYNPGANAMGVDHPISWKRQLGLGRSWYTGLGHRNETFADVGFRAHVMGGISWALGRFTQTHDGFER
jgi:type 1 glutamine amidotransferase